MEAPHAAPCINKATLTRPKVISTVTQAMSQCLASQGMLRIGLACRQHEASRMHAQHGTRPTQAMGRRGLLEPETTGWHTLLQSTCKPAFESAQGMRPKGFNPLTKVTPPPQLGNWKLYPHSDQGPAGAPSRECEMQAR